MKLTKHDPQTDMEMNMTPMIDVVFLLIIFFMIINDLTQKELEELQLPVAVHAVPDKPDPTLFRPIVNITIDGSMWVRRKKYYDPEQPDDYQEIRNFLTDVAVRMKKDEKDNLPDEPLLIRADESTPFREVQKLMEQCGHRDIKIWKIQLAAAEPSDEERRQAGIQD